jgi:hypothetical protein
MSRAMIECPHCHDANSCGDYEGPTCEVCMGEGKIPSPHTDPGALLKLADELEWIAASSVPGEHKTLYEAAVAIRQSASHGSAGGERSEVQSEDADARFDADALQAAREIVALPENWTYTRRKAAIQVIVAREMARALASAQAGRTWDVAMSERVMQLEAGGAKTLSISAILGLIGFVRDGEGSEVAIGGGQEP